MKPLRLLVVRPTLATGGADRVTLTLLRHFDRQLFEPTLALMRAEGALLAEVPPDVEVVDLGAANLWVAAKPLRQLIAQRRPDVLFSTSSGTNITAARARGKRGGPRLVLSERSGLVRDRPPLKQWALTTAKRRLYPRADCITAVSRGVAGDLESRLGLDPERIVVVHNPVVTPELERRAAQSVSEPWFDEETPVLIAAGRLESVKGFDLLIEAVRQVREHHDCRLILLGEGPLRDALQRQIESAGLAPHVKMPGFVDNPYAYMSRSQMFVLSSHFEGLPAVLIQAMACGIPVVTTDCPFGPAEVVTDGQDGLMVPTGDTAALAQGIGELLANPDRRHKLAEAGITSSRRFTLDNSLPRYVAALTGDTQ